ncbi:MAG: class I SAM-dependent methyltransferase [Rhizobium sp.]|nr:class I SAM-dependent methyltransferase [Rhizobium sp.]
MSKLFATAARRLRCTPLHPQWLLGYERRVFADAVHDARGTVLDVGCGDRWVESILPEDCWYVGLDSLSTGRSMYRSSPSVFGDAGKLPIADDSVDTVVMFEVLEHLPAPGAALREIHRCLSPEGKVVLSVPFLYPIHDAPIDFQRYTEHGLRRALERENLSVESISARLSSVRTAAMLGCLAIAGSARRSMERPGPALLLLPIWGVMVLLLNVGALLLDGLVPDWSAMTNGYVVIARKVSRPAALTPGAT